MNKIYEETKFLMKKYNITANKNLGQNFLIDEDVINSIVNSANITDNDLVIEIGPGLGTLTAKLLEKAKKVICIELDTKMIPILNERFAFYNNFELINQDILKIDLKSLLNEEISKNRFNVKIVANLPYYITTPILMKLIEDKLPIESITVMVQKEVADRLTAIPGEKNTGAITYSINYYCVSNEVVFVPKDSFIPVPKVDSSVIHLAIRKQLPVELKNETLFFKIIKANFMQRRKTLLNALVNNGIESKETISKILTDLNIPLNVRGETLNLEQFAKISNSLS